MGKIYLTKNIIWDILVRLSYSQGCWGRLCRNIREAGEEGQEFLQSLEDMKFRDELSLVLYLEGNA